MPTYQYVCTACGHELETVQGFSDDPLTECAECRGRLRKVFSPVGVVFKGSGFYHTDSRKDDDRAAQNGSGAAEKQEKPDGSGGNATGDGSSTGSTASTAESGPSRDRASGGSASSTASDPAGGGSRTRNTNGRGEH